MFFLSDFAEVQGNSGTGYFRLISKDCSMLDVEIKTEVPEISGRGQVQGGNVTVKRVRQSTSKTRYEF